jgi:hypothetical protein
MQARFKRVVLAAAIIAAFGTMLAYVGLASGAGKIQIAEFYYNPSPYGIASYKAAVTEGNKLGAQVTTFDGNNVPQTQTTQMTDAITTGKYKGFWVWALDGVSADRPADPGRERRARDGHQGRVREGGRRGQAVQRRFHAGSRQLPDGHDSHRLHAEGVRDRSDQVQSDAGW